MRNAIRLAAVCALAACAATGAGGITQDRHLSLGEVTVPEYGQDPGRVTKNTIYPVASAGSFEDPSVWDAPEWSMKAWTVGRTLCEQPSDFRIGETCSLLPTNVIDWARTEKATTNKEGLVFNMDATNATERIIFTKTGAVEVNWVFADGQTNSVDYRIDRLVSARPYRLYATRADEGNMAAYVDLSGKYVKFFGDRNLIETNLYEKLSARATTSNLVYGLDYDAQNGLLTYRYKMDKDTGRPICPQGQFVLAYYDTETKDHMVSRIVVEVTPPTVNTLSAHVGEELRPLGGGYDIAGLSPIVNSGTKADPEDPCSPYAETYETEKSTAAGDEKGHLKVYAIAPTDVSTSKLGMDMPWKVDIYWRSPDPMGTLWTFEDDWYLVTWPEDAPTVVTSGDSANPGYPLVLPSVYSATVMNYRRPLHMEVSYDESTHRVTSSAEGRFLLRLTTAEDSRPRFLPVESVLRDDERVCSDVTVPWPVGREIVLCRGEDAGCAAAAADRMDASLPGYIHVPKSDGRNWNPRLYHFNAGGALDGIAGSTPGASDPFASLTSAIYGVNEAKGLIEVWWSGAYKGDKGKGTDLQEPVTYPGFVQKFQVRWDLAEIENLYPTIHLYSQKGSADETLTASAGYAVVFARSNSVATVNGQPRFRAHERLHLALSISSLQRGGNDHAVTPGRIATVRNRANRRIFLAIEVSDADTNGYTVVTRGAGSEISPVRLPHLEWREYQVEIPPKLADSDLEVIFGSPGKGEDPAAVNIAIDDLACWRGTPDEAKSVENVEFLFKFGIDETDDGEGKKDKTGGAAALIGGCSLSSHDCGLTFGAPMPYYGLFAAENGVEPELYYQNDETQIGYNPNEEHALMEKTDDGYVAWAIRNDLNFEDTSHAMVFVQYAENGKGRMAPFRIGAVPGQETYPVVLGDDDGEANGNGEGEKVILPPNAPDPNSPGAFTNTVVVGSPLLVPKPISLMSPSGSQRDQAFMAVFMKTDGNPVYKDRKNQLWARRDGVVEVKYYYPTQPGFKNPTVDKIAIDDGTFIGWMNNVGRGRPTAGSLTNNPSMSWFWQSVWPTNGVPTMRIGQTLTKPVAGLPEMWNAASMAVAYPTVRTGNETNLVHLIDPTVARTASLKFDTGDFPSEFGFTVGATGTCSLRKGKYYFTGCPPSVSDRFYVDANAAVSNRMVLVGDYVEKEAGGSYLRLNVLTDDERKALKALCKLDGTTAKTRWDAALDQLATGEKRVAAAVERYGNVTATNGNWTVRMDATFVIPKGDDYGKAFERNITNGYVVCSSGDSAVTTSYTNGLNRALWRVTEKKDFQKGCNTPEYAAYKARFEGHIAPTLCWTNTTGETKGLLKWPKPTKPVLDLVRYTGTFTWITDDKSLAVSYDAKDHLALVATGENYGDGWVTLVENDDPDPAHVAPGLPVQMHVIRVLPELHSDGIAVVTDPLNKLSEQLTLLYRTPFGDAAKDFAFEWRRTKPNADGTLNEKLEEWDVYKGSVTGRVSLLLGANGAQPDEYVNTYYTLRYRPIEGTTAYNVLKEALRKAHPFDYKDDMLWSAWAQPQLAEGWLQRVLNSVTPFAQRVEDFYANPSDIGYTMLEQIGRPYTGDVALNNDNLTQIGLMELYQTLFNRVETMLVACGGDRDLSKQLLLAATRLNEFYTLLGAEAYSDAKNPLIGSADGTMFPAGTFSFANQVRTLLDEELALLRGRAASTQFPLMTEAPCFNRLVWNFTKGITEGEPAYVNNYGIRARDGIMDVNCAAAQYPQGHGDAWGHYLSAVKTYYRLLRNPAFDWTASMTEMLMDQKIANVDYQDEQKFADAAAKLAQTGLDAFELTLRKDYGERGAKSEEGRGDGYFDANTNQAFGCGEWLTRTEMGAAYNWMVGNALLPTNDAPNQEFADRGIRKIDRTTALSLGTLCTIVDTLDKKLADYGAGLNPLGLAEGAIPFDIDPDELAAKNSHFEQILARAEKALANCRTVLDYANVYGSRLRQLQEDETDALAEREKTELAYNNQLISIYGTPFPGDIGPGGTYPQGYEGPDLYNYNCMDLEPYGLEKLETDLSVTPTNFTRTNFTLSRQAGVDITYTVTPGGIRVKNDNMTGVRATEGTLQAKYRDYLVAYRAYRSAAAAYVSAMGAVNTAASDATTDMVTSTISAAIKAFVLGFEQGYADDSSTLTGNRWSMLNDELEAVRKALYSQTGLSIAGTAFGSDAIKKVKLVKEQMAQEVCSQQKKTFYDKKDELDFIDGKFNGLLPGLDDLFRRGEKGWALYENDLPMLKDDWTELFVRNFVTKLEPIGISKVGNGNYIAKIVIAWFQFLFDNGLALGLKGRDLGRSIDTAIGNAGSALDGVQAAIANLSTAEAEYRAELYRGQLLLEERARWRQQMSNEATASRYADMFNRVQRNIALTKYSTAFDTAQRYVWELAKVYDYETGLLSSDEKSGKQFLADIIATRSLGVEGVPIASGTTDGGLYDVVARMKQNWDVLEGRLGINNPDKPTKWFSLRHDCFQIGYDVDGDKKWGTALRGRIVDDIGADADFRRYCQPLALSESTSQGPAIVITFETSVWGDKNFFGKPLVPGNEQFSAADYATKIDAVGVYFQGYDEHAVAGGAFVREPNVYLVPVGTDCMRSPVGTDDREVIGWNVVDQVLPLPYAIGSTELDNPSWISTFSGPGGSAANIRRHSTLRMGYNLTSNRLVGRSVWNTKWMLVIPARSIGSSERKVLETFAQRVKDIKLGIRAYSRSGN